MSRSPILWGAGLVCALGGAITGTALGSSPLVAAAATTEYYQEHKLSNARMPDAGAAAIPDRYPLVTPRGTVPVAQLSERGLFSQARYRLFDDQTDVASAVSQHNSDFADEAPADTDANGSAPREVSAAVAITRGSRPPEAALAAPVAEDVLAL